ncbi:NUDIX hydrolase [Alicyclobacillus sp. ALC3]|uniref:NUDIX hydrolase n=1 Tax=Alicyclobacillus sp. ALC3 TaxID=2796143 RepID=UPI00237840C3|nr:NUDIX domain-containing protein [Alicyclobacillus sp. ALC3]WDL97516.1 NUDIX hydrolase [Alicyclobacillus sp. ALC3]
MAAKSNKQKKAFLKLEGLPVDMCVFTVATEQRSATTTSVDRRSLRSYPNRYLALVLVQRLQKPEKGKWSLPGGFTKLRTETLDEAARRELKEETNLDATTTTESGPEGSLSRTIHLEQMKTYYTFERDERGPTPTVAYVALVEEALLANLHAGGDARDAQLFRIRRTQDEDFVCESQDGSVALTRTDLAFDHGEIISDALRFVESKVMTTTVAKTLLPEEFTITQLHQVISVIVPSYAPTTTNFARDLVKTKSRDGLLEEVLDENGTPKTSSDYSARPAKLYRFQPEFEPRLSIYPRF